MGWEEFFYGFFRQDQSHEVCAMRFLQYYQFAPATARVTSLYSTTTNYFGEWIRWSYCPDHSSKTSSDLKGRVAQSLDEEWKSPWTLSIWGICQLNWTCSNDWILKCSFSHELTSPKLGSYNTWSHPFSSQPYDIQTWCLHLTQRKFWEDSKENNDLKPIERGRNLRIFANTAFVRYHVIDQWSSGANICCKVSSSKAALPWSRLITLRLLYVIYLSS
jgi:hypothetical protein